MRILTSLICGLLFGIGLAISGMMSPQKVLGFLDIWSIPDGAWDPSLALVMVGGLIFAFPFFRFARTKSHAVNGGKITMPNRTDIDWKLVSGSLLFGAGWGLVGYCPGPAISALATGQWKSFLFVGAMISGMLLFKVLPARNKRV